MDFFSKVLFVITGLFAVQTFGQQRMISHVTQAGGGFATEIILTNATQQARRYELVGFDSLGARIANARGSIPGQATLYRSAQELFEGAAVSHFVISEGMGIRVSAAYRATSPNSSPAHIEESAEQSHVWRIWPGNPAVTWDGVALVNTGRQTATLTLLLVDKEGREQDRYWGVRVEPNAKELMLLNDVFEVGPNTYYEIQSDQPLALTALRGDLNTSAFLWENVAMPVRDEHLDPVVEGPAEMRELPPFQGVDHRIIGDLYLRQGPHQQVTLIGQPHFVRLVRTRVVDGVLRLSLPEGKLPTDFKVDMDITIPEITSIDLSGIGQIRSQNKWSVGDVTVSHTGIGTISVYLQAQSITTTHSGIGTIELRGNASTHDIDFGGIGDLRAFGLNVDDCTIVMSTPGSIEVHVNEVLDVEITGFGAVAYKGYPEITRTGHLGTLINAN